MLLYFMRLYVSFRLVMFDTVWITSYFATFFLMLLEYHSTFCWYYKTVKNDARFDACASTGSAAPRSSPDGGSELRSPHLYIRPRQSTFGPPSLAPARAALPRDRHLTAGLSSAPRTSTEGAEALSEGSSLIFKNFCSALTECFCETIKSVSILFYSIGLFGSQTVIIVGPNTTIIFIQQSSSQLFSR